MLDVETGTLTVVPSGAPVTGGTWHPDSRRIAYSLDGRIALYDVVEKGAAQVISEGVEGASSPSATPEGNWILFHGAGTSLGVWASDLRDGSVRRVFRGAGRWELNVMALPG